MRRRFVIETRQTRAWLPQFAFASSPSGLHRQQVCARVRHLAQPIRSQQLLIAAQIASLYFGIRELPAGEAVESAADGLSGAIASGSTERSEAPTPQRTP